MTILNTRYSIPNTAQRGFTLVETMVAISILLITVVAPMSTIGGSLSQISTVRDQMIAVNLAQEGIEVARQVRDSTSLQRWSQGTSGFTVAYTPTSATTQWGAGLTVGEYIVDATTNPLTFFRCGALVDSCSATQKSIYQSISGMYQQHSDAPSGEKTQFNRIVNVTDIHADREKKIVSTVTWKTSGGVDKTISVSESIFGIST